MSMAMFSSPYAARVLPFPPLASPQWADSIGRQVMENRIQSLVGVLSCVYHFLQEQNKSGTSGSGGGGGGGEAEGGDAADASGDASGGGTRAVSLAEKPPLNLLRDKEVVEALWTGKQSMMRRLIRKLDAVYQEKLVVDAPAEVGGGRVICCGSFLVLSWCRTTACCLFSVLGGRVDATSSPMLEERPSSAHRNAPSFAHHFGICSFPSSDDTEPLLLGALWRSMPPCLQCFFCFSLAKMTPCRPRPNVSAASAPSCGREREEVEVFKEWSIRRRRELAQCRAALAHSEACGLAGAHPGVGPLPQDVRCSFVGVSGGASIGAAGAGAGAVVAVVLLSAVSQQVCCIGGVGGGGALLLLWS